MIPFLNTSKTKRSSGPHRVLTRTVYNHSPFGPPTASSLLAQEAQQANLKQELKRIRLEYPNDPQHRFQELSHYKSHLESSSDFERKATRNRIRAAHQEAESNRHLSRRGLLDAVISVNPRTITFVNKVSRMSAKRDKAKISNIKQGAKDTRRARRGAIGIINKELEIEAKNYQLDTKEKERIN